MKTFIFGGWKASWCLLQEQLCLPYLYAKILLLLYLDVNLLLIKFLLFFPKKIKKKKEKKAKGI